MIMRALLAAFYLGAGVLHFRATDSFLLITPDWVPFARQVIQVTGLCELLGAVGLLTHGFRSLAGVLLALYAACVFPANIKHALDGISVPGLPDTWWYHGPRLAFQPVLIWWTLFCAEVIDYPLKRDSKPPG